MGGIQVYTDHSPTAQDYSLETTKMERALESHFNCDIDSSNYQLIVWYQKLSFKISKDSKFSVSEEEASNYLASNFPTFKYIDTFKLTN